MLTTTRAVTKDAIYRTVSFASLTMLLYLCTGSLLLSASTSILHTIVEAALSYSNNRIWNRVRWGKMQGLAIQMTGLSGSGKSTIAHELKRRLEARGIQVEVIDGDDYRAHLCADLGFSKEHRIENIRRLACVAHKLSEAGCVSIITAINPYEESRSHLRALPNHMTVFVNADIKTVIERDTKGLYKRAMLSADDPKHIPHFTGISDPFEIPQAPDLVVDTSRQSIEKSVSMIESAVLARLRHGLAT